MTTINDLSFVMIDPNEDLVLPDGTVITGRLERFIYALCCLDYEHLQTPMSRIEEWANALITNEIPNIDPQSRAEKFFKAILTGDLSDLPEPQSRSEVLLDKIARGDNDLTNIEPIQSRYELLLAYLVKNGGLENLDYVLYEFQKEAYTMLNTVEKPYKSAILSGNTLVNMGAENQILSHCQNDTCTYIEDDNYVTITVPSMSVPYSSSVVKNKTSYDFIEGKTYTIISDTSCVPIDIIYNDEHLFSPKSYRFAFVAPKNMAHIDIYYRKYADIGSSVTYKIPKKIVILEGDYTNVDIPYFEGMKSVKMPVLMTHTKNLFDGEIENGIFQMATHGTYPANVNHNEYIRSKNLIRVIKNSTYTISSSVYVSSWYIAFLNSDGHYCNTPKVEGLGRNVVFTTPKDCMYIRFYTGTSDTSAKIQIENGSKVTEYTGDYKTNILSTSEEVELRGIGEVKDELNLITGELTQRISEIVLDGSDDETWVFWNSEVADVTGFYLDNTIDDASAKNQLVLCDCLPSTEAIISGINKENIYISETKRVNLNISITKATSVNELRNYLSQNPITVQYPLATESVKTVDLTTVDQDGGVLPKPKSYNDVTHVTVSSTDILPSVELEVASKIVDDVLTTSINDSLDTISAKQSELKTVINTQTENGLLAMMATTEIYEDLL